MFFLRQKTIIISALILLAILMSGVWWSSERIYQRIAYDKELKTSAKVNSEMGKTVVIDAGHGGKDSGKIGINKVLEKDINLEIAKKVKELLLKQKVNVIMTREDDRAMAESKTEDLKKRVDIINEANADLAVSIHQNSYTSEEIHGAQVFYYNHSEEGRKAAAIFQKILLKIDPENKRQEKGNDSYFILKKTEAPVIIVECGFLSNKQEAEKLVTEEYQDILAEAICDGITEFLK